MLSDSEEDALEEQRREDKDWSPSRSNTESLPDLYPQPMVQAQARVGRLTEGDSYNTLDEAIKAVQQDGETSGFKMRQGQSFQDDSGWKKVTMRCSSYQGGPERHRLSIHPGNRRRGKTIRTECMAHININRVKGSSRYYLSLVDTHHNHPPVIPVSGKAQRPPTAKQREIVTTYATDSSFSQCQIKHLLNHQSSDRPLEDRQITNLINQSREEAREAVSALGGDAAAVVARLESLRQQDNRWEIRTRVAEDGRVTAIWWQSPAQADLILRFPDILINNIAEYRNQYGYPLNIGIVVDDFGHSRNVWYCLHERQDADTHAWNLRNHLSTAPRAPEVFASDRDAALESAVPKIMPSTFHFICLHHLCRNIVKNLRAAVGSEWNGFVNAFWSLYQSVSPGMFDARYSALIQQFPASAAYLNLFPVRQRWAWAWVSCRFTTGIRTNGRVECENQVNKILSGPKVPFVTLVDRLIERMGEQTTKHLISTRNVSCSHIFGDDQINETWVL